MTGHLDLGPEGGVRRADDGMIILVIIIVIIDVSKRGFPGSSQSLMLFFLLVSPLQAACTLL